MVAFLAKKSTLTCLKEVNAVSNYEIAKVIKREPEDDGNPHANSSSAENGVKIGDSLSEHAQFNTNY